MKSELQNIMDLESAKKTADSDSVFNIDSTKSQIKEKSLSWPQASFLLLLEYVVIALLALPSSWTTLGYGGGILTTILVGLSALYTQHVLWRYCMKNPHVQDICDIAADLVGGGRVGQFAWWSAFLGLVLNNVCIMALHAVQGSVSLNTISEGAVCTQVYAVVITLVMLFASLFRELKYMSFLGAFAASTMLVCIILAMIFSGVQGLPANHTEGPIIIRPWAAPGTTGLSGVISGTNAVLNILYTYVGHILVPSFIADMKEPKDFPKALYVSITAEIILFSLAGGIIYSQIGEADMTSPAYGSLIAKYKKAIAAFVLPTVIIVGSVYCIITARTIFSRFFSFNSVHRRAHTIKGWGSWSLIVLTLWIIAYIIGQAIPVFNDLISLISALFDSWFGYIFWFAAFFKINRHNSLRGWGILEAPLNVIMLIVGLLILGLGSYTSVESIIQSYHSGNAKTPFSCTNNGY